MLRQFSSTGNFPFMIYVCLCASAYVCFNITFFPCCFCSLYNTNTGLKHVSSFMPVESYYHLSSYLQSTMTYKDENWSGIKQSKRRSWTVWDRAYNTFDINMCLHEHSIFAHTEYIKLNVWYLPFNFYHIVWCSGYPSVVYATRMHFSEKRFAI